MVSGVFIEGTSFGKLTTVLMPTPNVAASWSLRLSGVLICKSPLTIMYSPNAPPSGRTLLDPCTMPQMRSPLANGLVTLGPTCSTMPA